MEVAPAARLEFKNVKVDPSSSGRAGGALRAGYSESVISHHYLITITQWAYHHYIYRTWVLHCEDVSTGLPASTIVIQR